MKERPILFSTPMVKAILDGRKTQTRRVVKPRKDLSFGCLLQPNELAGEINNGSYCNSFYGKPGDRLWVRETWSQHPRFADIAFRADGEEFEDSDGFTWIPKWKPSIHMPRKVSRINLEITGVHIESLHDISEQDALAEGMASSFARSGDTRIGGSTKLYGIEPDITFALNAKSAYEVLWEKINGIGSWSENPWVWVICFNRAKNA